MSFLAPYAGLIAAAVALPLLLTLYFLKLRRRPVRVSSTLLWEQASRDLEVNAPFRMIRPSWSLFLHLLILALLCLAIARPALDLRAEPAQEVVFVIDRSASMNARDAPGPEGRGVTRLQSAKRDADEILGRLGGGARAMVVGFADTPRIVSTMSPDLAGVGGAIRRIEPTDQPGDLARALRLVESVAGDRTERESSDAGRRIVVLSDGDPVGAAREDQPFRLPPGSIEYIPSLPEGVAPGENHAMIACDASRDRDELSKVRLFCRVQSVNTETREVPVTLRLNGRAVSSAVVALSPSPDGGTRLEGSHTFEFDDGGEGGLAVVTQGIDDALPADDAFALTLTRPIGPRVMLVRGVSPTSPVDFVIEDALSVPSLRVRDLETITIESYEQRAPDPGDDGSRVRLVPMSDGSPPDLVIFDRCAPSVMPTCPSVSFASGLPIPGLNLAPPMEATERVTFYRRTHPLMRYTDLGDLTISGARPITLPDESQHTTKTTALAVGQTGPLLAELRHAGVRRVIVGFALGGSAWWRQPGFPRFVKNSLDTLTESGVERADRSYTTAQAITLAPETGASAVRINGPIERTLTVEPGTGLSTVLPRAGVYRAGNAAPATLPVNLASSRESALRAQSALDLPTRSIRGGSASNIAPREVWHWFVLAAFAMLCLEWLHYTLKMRG